MKKHWRQVKHRRVSKKGRLFNAGSRKRVIIIKKKGKISPKKREIFSYLDKRPTETGGYLDFDENDLENVIAYFGDEDTLDVPHSDFEVEWHTHPPSSDKVEDNLNFLPSTTDLDDFLYEGKPQQAMTIFHRGKILTVTKTKKTNNYLRRTPRKEASIDLKEYEQKSYEELMKNPEAYKNPKLIQELFDKFGLKVNLIKKDEKAEIPIKVVQ